MKYNVAMVSVFDVLDVGVIECKRIVSIPWILRFKSIDEIARRLFTQQQKVLAVKFLKIETEVETSFSEFVLLRREIVVDEESSWYINPKYDMLKIGNIHSLAEPSILLRGDLKRAKYRLDYYVDLRSMGYSEEEAISTIYS